MSARKKSSSRNPLVEKYLNRFEGPEAGGPLPFDEAAEIFNAYRKLDQRLSRIARISDNFQSELQDLKRELEHTSRTDYLTGLSNRRDIYERILAEQSRCRRNGKIFSIIMADFDLFKNINDTYGHAVGDQLLSATAAVFRRNLRKEDCCARWGGEEFLILLPETDGASALKVAEKLRHAVARHFLEIGSSSISTTLSFGVSGYLAGEENAEPCLARADQALYQAKNNGRNQSVLFSEDPPGGS